MCQAGGAAVEAVGGYGPAAASKGGQAVGWGGTYQGRTIAAFLMWWGRE